MPTRIDSYLQMVGAVLPADRRQDIVRELAEDIRAQVADREEGAGRALTDEEVAGVLNQFGHPLVLATRYGPQRHVVGPALFPIYWSTLKIALTASAAVNVAIAIALVLSGTPTAKALGPLFAFPFTIALTVFGWVTLIFWLVDMNLPRLIGSAGFDAKAIAAVSTTPPPLAPRRWEVIAEIIGASAFLIWWLSIPSQPFLVFGPAAAFMALAPVWQQVYAPMTALWVGGIVLLSATLLRPDWARGTAISRIGSDVLGLAIAFILLRADAIVELAPHATATPGALQAIDLTNTIGQIVVVIWIVAAIVSIAQRAFRIVTARSTGPDAD
jgi:hypothetical protein